MIVVNTHLDFQARTKNYNHCWHIFLLLTVLISISSGIPNHTASIQVLVYCFIACFINAGGWKPLHSIQVTSLLSYRFVYFVNEDSSLLSMKVTFLLSSTSLLFLGSWNIYEIILVIIYTYYANLIFFFWL